MKTDMLASQFDTLEKPSDAIVVNVAQPPGTIVEQILAELPVPTPSGVAGLTDRRKGQA